MPGRSTVLGAEAVGDRGISTLMDPEIPPTAIWAAPAVRQPLRLVRRVGFDHRWCCGAVMAIEVSLGQPVELGSGCSAAAAESDASSDSSATLVGVSGLGKNNICEMIAAPSGHC